MEEIRRSVNDGAELRSVDSTDDRLVLVFEGTTDTDRYRLDADDTRNLLAAGVLEEVTERRSEAKMVV
ncbi:hypothetical protein BRD56_04315 [Thermoplasmatales archaeon SW_10_69_26]|nr:MAG: hypothetical protein BRD56_04315 [Thermoplasmatales archaeon SW_10_69_26]